MKNTDKNIISAMKLLGWVIDQLLELTYQLFKAGFAFVLGVGFLTWLAGAFIGAW